LTEDEDKEIDLSPSEYKRLGDNRREPIFGPGIWMVLGNENLWAALIVAGIYYWLKNHGYMDVFKAWLFS
jgi:hypothetical protein